MTRIAEGKSTVVARGHDAAEQHRPALDPGLPRASSTKSIASFDGGASKAFAGQRDDPFFGDVGAIFDLVAIRKGTGNAGGGKDFFAGYGVHTYRRAGPDRRPRTPRTARSACGPPSSGGRSRPAAPRPATQELGAGRPARQPARQRGHHPDRAEGPLERPSSRGASGSSSKYYENPILAAVINKLYKLGAPETGRDDLVAVLLTGVPKLNFTGPKLADVLRLNLGDPGRRAKPNRLGVLGGDTQGWPNGRRLDDDVIDIAEQAVGGFLKDVKLPLGDGVNADDVDLLGRRSPTWRTRSPGSTTRRASRSPDTRVVGVRLAGSHRPPRARGNRTGVAVPANHDDADGEGGTSGERTDTHYGCTSRRRDRTRCSCSGACSGASWQRRGRPARPPLPSRHRSPRLRSPGTAAAAPRERSRRWNRRSVRTPATPTGWRARSRLPAPLA